MSPLLYLACAWPGLPALWLRGRWSGLGWALLFSAVLNTALLATFVWPEWLSWAMTTTLWIAAGSLCILGYWQSLTQLPKLLGTTSDPQAEQKLVDAQCAYLQGRYYEAEQALRRLLHLQPDDPEARLLLASVYRRTNRKKEALDALKRLAEAPRGGRWLFEASRLRSAILEMSYEPVAPEPEAPLPENLASSAEESSDELQPEPEDAAEQARAAEHATVSLETRSRAA
jgi:tetratricopeptide (TPR) repeat protein